MTAAAAAARANLGAHGIGRRQRQVLEVIAASGASWIHEIAREIGIDRPTAAALVRTLRQRGLIEDAPRIRHDASPYAKLLWLTPAGRDVINERAKLLKESLS